MIKAGFLPGDPAKVDPRHRGRAHPGRSCPSWATPPSSRRCAGSSIPFVVLFAVMLGVRHPARQPARRQAQRRLADLHGGARLHHRAERARLDRERQRLHPLLPDRRRRRRRSSAGSSSARRVPEILIMTLGAVVGTFVLEHRHRRRRPPPLRPPERHPGLVRRGLPALRHRAALRHQQPRHVLLGRDAAGDRRAGASATRPCSSTASSRSASPCTPSSASSFTQYLSDFVDIVIVWIAPWCAIFLVDWVLRRYRYVPGELQKTGRDSLYWRTGGVHWPAIVAQLVGMFAAISALCPPRFHLPHWLNEVTDHTRDRPTATGPTSASSSAWASPGSSTWCWRWGSVAPGAERAGRACLAAGAALAGAPADQPQSSTSATLRRRGGTAAWRRASRTSAASSPSACLQRRPRSSACR